MSACSEQEIGKFTLDQFVPVRTLLKTTLQGVGMLLALKLQLLCLERTECL